MQKIIFSEIYYFMIWLNAHSPAHASLLAHYATGIGCNCGFIWAANIENQRSHINPTANPTSQKAVLEQNKIKLKKSCLLTGNNYFSLLQTLSRLWHKKQGRNQERSKHQRIRQSWPIIHYVCLGFHQLHMSLPFCKLKKYII